MVEFLKLTASSFVGSSLALFILIYIFW